MFSISKPTFSAGRGIAGWCDELFSLRQTPAWGMESHQGWAKDNDWGAVLDPKNSHRKTNIGPPKNWWFSIGISFSRLFWIFWGAMLVCSLYNSLVMWSSWYLGPKIYMFLKQLVLKAFWSSCFAKQKVGTLFHVGWKCLGFFDLIGIVMVVVWEFPENEIQPNQFRFRNYWNCHLPRNTELCNLDSNLLDVDFNLSRNLSKRSRRYLWFQLC